MKADFNQLIQETQKMNQNQKNIEVIGESGAGLVKITMTGKYEVNKVDLDQTLLSENKDIIEDLLAAAINDAVRRIAEQTQSSISKLAQAFKLPNDFKFNL